jgi:hypothetical protein
VTEKQKVVKRKYGEGWEWEFGQHYRMTLPDIPLTTRIATSTEANPYLEEGAANERPHQSPTQIHRPTLQELFPFVEKALRRHDTFLVERMEDGRSDPRGYSPLRADEMTLLMAYAQNLAGRE